MPRQEPSTAFALERQHQLILQDREEIRLYVAERQTHAETGMGINHAGAGLEIFVVAENLQRDDCAGLQGIYGIQVAAVEAEFCNARTYFRA